MEENSKRSSDEDVASKPAEVGGSERTALAPEKDASNLSKKFSRASADLGQNEMRTTGGLPDQGMRSRIDESMNEPQVLDPDNPLMVKFQAALRDLLQKQLNKLDEEVTVLNTDLRSKSKEREQLGVHLFSIQEEVARSHKKLSAYNNSLENLEDMRKNLEDELSQIRALYREELDQLNKAHHEEEKMRLEMEEIKCVEWQLQQWEADYDSERAVSQRIADKTEMQKKEISVEKQKQDLLLLKLRRVVMQLESQREKLRAQTEIKCQQQQALSNAISSASTDLEALQAEQVRLTRVWNGVVMSIQQRDKVFMNVQNDLLKVKESFHLMVSEIGSYKRVAKFEMQHSEKIMSILRRLEEDYNSLSHNHEKNKERLSRLETEYASVSTMLKATEEDFNSSLMEGKILSQQSLYLQRELERLTLQKISLEMQILEKLQDQSKHDKASQHFARTIRALKENNKNQEMSFIMMENQIAKTMVEIEQARGTVVYNEHLLQNASAEAEASAQELARLEEDVRDQTRLMHRKMNIIEELTKKLDAVVARHGNEESPIDSRIKAIETEIEEAVQDTEKKQGFWLRLQSHLVHLSEECQEQTQQLHLLYKQLHVLNQRVLKIEHEIELHKDGESNICRKIRSMNVSLDKMSMSLHNRRGYKESLDKENTLVQAESLAKLKDLERESIEMDQEILDLEEINLLLNQEILDYKQQCMAWQSKVQMASETKQVNDDTNKASGELGLLRNEIHRMEVRFSQLCKVQETLVKDLEHCVMRREALLDQADAREKRSSGNLGVVSNRIVFQRKLDNLKNKIKQAKLESKVILKCIENNLNAEEMQMSRLISSAALALTEVEQAASVSKNQLEEAQLLKQQKLDTLVRRQKKVRMYNRVKEGKHRVLFRTETALEAETYRQKNINNDILSIVEALQQHFPTLQLRFLRLKNTLQVFSAQL